MTIIWKEKARRTEREKWLWKLEASKMKPRNRIMKTVIALFVYNSGFPVLLLVYNNTQQIFPKKV